MGEDSGPSFAEPTFKLHKIIQETGSLNAPHVLDSGVAGSTWNLSTQTVTLDQDNASSDILWFQFTQDTPLASGSPHYGAGGSSQSMLLPFKGISANRSAAWAASLAYYVSTSWASTPNFDWETLIWFSGQKYDDGTIPTPPYGDGSSTRPYAERLKNNYEQSDGTYPNVTTSTENGGLGRKFYPASATAYYRIGSDYEWDLTTAGAVAGGIDGENDITGEDIKGFNQVDPDNLWVKVQVKTNPRSGIPNYSGVFHANALFQYDHTQTDKYSLLYWQGVNHFIDGVGSDTMPTMSMVSSLVCTPAQHYYIEPVSVNTAFTIAEGSECFVIAPPTTMAAVSTVAMTDDNTLKLGTTKNFSVVSELGATTYNFVIMDPVAASSAFTFAVTPTLILAPASIDITSAATTSFDSNMIFDVLGDYTWNQFSNNPFIVTGYVKGGYTNDAEYEWDDLTTDTWDNWTYGTWLGDEAGWDDWPDNTWERTFGFISNFTQADTPPLLKVGGASAISSAFTITENAALAKAAAASLSSAFTITATSQGLIDVTQDLSSAFTLAVSDVDYKDDVTLSELGTLSAAFTTSFTGSIKYALDEEIAISSALTFTLATGFVKYDIEDTPASAFTTSFTGSIKYDPSLTLSALASQLSVGSLLTQADPYNIITVDAETRTFVVPAESRSTVVQEENRLNIISSETRLENVLEETRVHKLKIPGLTNIYSTPRVRSEA